MENTEEILERDCFKYFFAYLIGDVDWRMVCDYYWNHFFLMYYVDIYSYWVGYCEIDDILNNTIGTTLRIWLINKFEKRIEGLCIR